MKSTQRRKAHRQLDDYIDWLLDHQIVHGDNGDNDTDGWLLSIDQDANSAAAAERAVRSENAEKGREG